MRLVPLFVAALALAAHPILADQLAGFSCQSTQGNAWSGNSWVIKERMVLTIHPDYLDVEHELELNASDEDLWNRPEFPNSLEIHGWLNMQPGTVMTSFLLWNGDKLLKGKLQSKDLARRKYEEVVDRNVTDPPPPRDPAILEKTGENAYALSIFPVALSGSRKIRLRYVIPSFYQEGAQRMNFPQPFSQIASVTIQGGPGTSGYALTSMRPDGSLTTVKNEENPTQALVLDPEAFQYFQPYYYPSGTLSGAFLRQITPLFGNQKGTRVILGDLKHPKAAPGQVSHIVFHAPAALVDPAPGPKDRLVAILKAGAESIRKQINPLTDGNEELRLYALDALEEGIAWKLYNDKDSVVRETVEKPLVITMDDGDQYARTFGNVPFYPAVKAMPKSMAAAWGFVDARYALLALEQDTLKASVARDYALAGVPTLNPEDIFPDDGSIDSIPLTAWMVQKNFDRDELLQPTSIGALKGLPPGIRWRMADGMLLVEVDPSALGPGLRIGLYGLDGRVLKEWSRSDLGKGRVAWSPREAGYRTGICLMRIVSAGKVHSARVIVK